MWGHDPLLILPFKPRPIPAIGPSQYDVLAVIQQRSSLSLSLSQSVCQSDLISSGLVVNVGPSQRSVNEWAAVRNKS